MPIYDIFETNDSDPVFPLPSHRNEVFKGKSRLLSSMTARVVFFLLLIGDMGWFFYTLARILVISTLVLLSFGKVLSIRRGLQKGWRSLKRASICGISLFVALFTPALGIMIGCTYFLMRDKEGINDIIPHSLRDQFQEFLQ